MPPISATGLSIQAILELNNLKAHASWIRDTLDLSIARDGPEAISVEDALYVDQYLRKLLQASISVQDIRLSRIHLALLEIAGGCTRWPPRLIERAESTIKQWETKFGPLNEIGTELLGPGGRLEGITVHEAHMEDLMVTWLKQGAKLLPCRARRWGDIGFTAGEYDTGEFVISSFVRAELTVI
ncbi:hypothetical protein MRB53_040026 [Persea americana]|nr:hypothetical protein MRB53_040026 [Persea americana]